MKDDSILNEIESLLNLLETISRNESDIEKSLQNISKQRYFFIFSFFTITFSLILIAETKKLSLSSTDHLFLGFGFITIFLMLVMAFRSNIDSTRKLKKKLEMENEIKNRIISIIHNQIARMDESDYLNPILHATIEMRLRRAAQNL